MAPAVKRQQLPRRSTSQFLWEARPRPVRRRRREGEMEASDLEAVSTRLKSLGLSKSRSARKSALDGRNHPAWHGRGDEGRTSSSPVSSRR